MKRGYRKAVFVVVYSFENGKPIYLILKRHKHWHGNEFIKGGVERKESYFHSVKREVFEETGKKAFKIKNHRIFGRYKYKRILLDKPGYIGQSYILFSAQINKKKIKIDEKEHNGYKWLEFDKAYRLLTHNNQKKCLGVVDKWLKNNYKKTS